MMTVADASVIFLRKRVSNPDILLEIYLITWNKTHDIIIVESAFQETK